MKLGSLLIRYCVIACCGLLAKQVWAGASPDAIQLLNQMTHSFATLSYDGVFVHSESMKMNSIRVRHLLKDGSQYESLEDLDGDKVDIVRVDSKVISVYPDAFIENDQAPMGMPFDRFKELDGARLKLGYDMQVEKEKGRIADRSVIQIRLIPKDNYRYGHVFWLDEENSFLLKHDLITPNGNLLERIQFTSVNFSPDLKQDDFTPKKDTYPKRVVEETPQHAIRQWDFDWLPAGFSLAWDDSRILKDGVRMLLLSDGMATVSVFIEPKKSAALNGIQQPFSALSMGATIAGEKGIKVDDKWYLFTMVGEVPVATVEKLMSVITPRPSP